MGKRKSFKRSGGRLPELAVPLPLEQAMRDKAQQHETSLADIHRSILRAGLSGWGLLHLLDDGE